MHEPIAALLRIDDDRLSAHAEVYGDDPGTRSVSLAAALASSAAWARLRETMSLVVRPDTGTIGLLGSVDGTSRALVDGMGWHVLDLVGRLRPVPYRDVEQACLDLAERIRKAVTDDELAGSRIVAIPRGGLIVAGILSYALGSRPASFLDRPVDTGLTVLIDDCAISGVRLREALARTDGGEILVVLLHAHPDLARHVEASEPRVRACLVARDLADHAPTRPDFKAWFRRWSERTPTAYWIGDPDHVVYPWNEPDTLIWNEATGIADAAWRVVPPSWCLKNRASAHDDDLQRCEPAPGPLMPSDSAIWAESGDATLVAGQEDPTAVALRGSARAMWRAIVQTGSADGAASIVAHDYGTAVTKVRADLDAFVDRLTTRGLIRR